VSSKAFTCPKCETETAGKFCGQCGKKIQLRCSSCGTEASPGARFCPQCGASLTGAARAKSIVPWIAIGAVGVILAMIGAFMILDRQESAAPSVTSTQSTASGTSTSALTPVEVAERLFNRVMAASERGDTEESQRFAPAAIEAYGQLATLDNDAHYHVGLVHLTMGDTESAQAELDAIGGSVPHHLFGIMLEHAIAEAKGDDDGIATAYARFVSAYNTELLTDRDEYRGHRTGIDGFRARAGTAVGIR
jgi:hypothetical protein